MVRDSYDMTALNTAIDALDNRIDGEVQLGLYAEVQDLLLDRIVWFLRNVELTKGIADLVAHYRDGIAAVAAALDHALADDALSARALRQQELTEAGVPVELAATIANLGPLTAAPDIVLVADRTGKAIVKLQLLTSPPALSSGLIALPRPHAPFRSRIISTGWRSIGRAIYRRRRTPADRCYGR